MKTDSDWSGLAESLKQARGATQELSAQLRKLQEGGRALRTQVASACSGGSCSWDGGAGGSAGAGNAGEERGAGSGAGGAPGFLGGALGSGLSSALRAAFTGDFTRVLQSTLASLVRGIAGSIVRSAGGGLGGGLLGTLVGGGLSMLLGKLFQRPERVQVDNVVRAEVLNFPQLASLDFATNPASRLFGARAIPRGPAFSVEVSYKSGAEELVTAKVAQKLADLNAMQGLN